MSVGGDMPFYCHRGDTYLLYLLYGEKRSWRVTAWCGYLSETNEHATSGCKVQLQSEIRDIRRRIVGDSGCVSMHYWFVASSSSLPHHDVIFIGSSSSSSSRNNRTSMIATQRTTLDMGAFKRNTPESSFEKFTWITKHSNVTRNSVDQHLLNRNTLRFLI